jgi:hypothetical protein
MNHRSTLSLAILLIFACIAAAPERAPRDNPFAAPTRRDAPGEAVDAKAKRLLAKWKPKFDQEKFNYTIAGPFVIAGNGSDGKIARYRDQTILAAAEALHAMFFDTTPKDPVLILLFESRGPYARLAKKWFDDDDVPHYGFYRRRENVMLMNVGTGTGTLVHELVHALIAPDFPDVPDWFNEGLGSLYEQCSIGRDGDGNGKTITGHENWRLPALQNAIRRDELRPLREMIEDESFYHGSRVGMNYAHARYLLMYLQEKKLLTVYYARFRDNAKEDPQGLKALEAVIAPQGLEAFEKDWRKWVLSLRFNG